MCYKTGRRRWIGVGNRAIASLTVLGGQEFHFPHFFLKFRSIFLVLPQTSLIFFLILTLRVGNSPTRKGPGYTTGGQVRLIESLLIGTLHVIIIATKLLVTMDTYTI